MAAARGAARVDSGGGGGAGPAAGVGACGSCPWSRGGGGPASRDGLHGETAGRQGAPGRHGAADSSDRGEPEPSVPHGARPAGRADGAGRPGAARGCGRPGREARAGTWARVGGPDWEGFWVAAAVLGLGPRGPGSRHPEG